jgi:heme A synthase
MIELLVYLAVFVIVVIVIWYILSQLTLPEPLNKILMIVLVVVGAVILIGLLLNLTGHGGIPLRLG